MNFSMLIKFIKQLKVGRSRLDKFSQFKKNGNLIVGEGSKIDDLNISILSSTNNYANVEIGKDCYLMGNITLYSEKAKIKIGDRVFIGPGTTLFCYDQIEIEDDVMISWGCTLIDTNAHSLLSEERKSDVTDWIKGPQYKNWSVVQNKKIKINKKSWIGFNSIITKGVEIDDGTVVACGSVVTKKTEPYTIVGGNPAVFIKKTS